MTFETLARKIIEELNAPDGDPEQRLNLWKNRLSLSQPIVFKYLLGEAKSNSFKNSFLVCFGIFHEWYDSNQTPIPKLTRVELRELIIRYDEISSTDLFPCIEQEYPFLTTLWKTFIGDRTTVKNICDIFQGISFCWWPFREKRVLEKMN